MQFQTLNILAILLYQNFLKQYTADIKITNRYENDKAEKSKDGCKMTTI